MNRFSPPYHINGKFRRVLGDARDNRHATIHGLDCTSNDSFFFLQGERGILTKGSQHDKTADTGVEACFDVSCGSV